MPQKGAKFLFSIHNYQFRCRVVSLKLRENETKERKKKNENQNCMGTLMFNGPLESMGYKAHDPLHVYTEKTKRKMRAKCKWLHVRKTVWSNNSVIAWAFIYVHKRSAKRRHKIYDERKDSRSWKLHNGKQMHKTIDEMLARPIKKRNAKYMKKRKKQSKKCKQHFTVMSHL